MKSFVSSTTFITYKNPFFLFSSQPHLPFVKTCILLFPAKVRKNSAKMEQLPEDVLLTIVKKVTASGTQNLFKFKATFVLHQRLASKKVVLRALPRDCVWCLSDHRSCAKERAFMQKISYSGHATYCVVMVSQLLQRGRPNMEEIKHILQKAATHGSDGANFFLHMLKVLAKDGFSMDDIFPIFKDLLTINNLLTAKEPS